MMSNWSFPINFIGKRKKINQSRGCNEKLIDLYIKSLIFEVFLYSYFNHIYINFGMKFGKNNLLTHHTNHLYKIY